MCIRDRILIVEDQKIMQKYFEYILMQDPEFRHVQTISDAREAVKICDYSVIDLVIMDVQTFHNHDGLSAGKMIREKYPYTKVLVVTSLIDPKVLERAKSGCADSLWYKDHGEEDIRSVKMCIRDSVSTESGNKFLELFDLLFFFLICFFHLLDQKLAGFIPEIIVTSVQLNFAIINISSLCTNLVQEVTVMGYHDNSIIKIDQRCV